MGALHNILVKLRLVSPSKLAGTKKQANNPAENEAQAAQSPSRNIMAEQQPIRTAATSSTLNITLQNKSNSSNAYAYITGLALDNNNKPIFIQADGKTIYYPSSPPSTGSSLEVDCAIPLGAPGSSTNVVIPRIAGGRVWFSIDAKLTFKLNPGPAIVEPSVTNSSDPNYNINWAFTEFTFNQDQLFANLTYVDFVSIPISLSLTNTSGQTQTVPGMAANGFNTIVQGLKTQASRDNRPWDQLVYSYNGNPLRILSPNNLLVSNGNAWGDYWDAYVNQVWSKFSSADITINTQASFGNITGRVSNNQLVLGDAGAFDKPNARDIFSNSTGPFATGSNAARNAVIPRLAAAFNRSTLLSANQFPNGSNPGSYYQTDPTNYYAKLVHQVQKDGRGYAFPYDDVVPDGGSDVAGVIYDSNPTLWTIAVGGN